MNVLKGWKMLIWGLLLAVSGPGLTYLAGIDWTQYVSPTWAPLIVGAVTIALRAVTDTPILKAQ